MTDKINEKTAVEAIKAFMSGLNVQDPKHPSSSEVFSTNEELSDAICGTHFYVECQLREGADEKAKWVHDSQRLYVTRKAAFKRKDAVESLKREPRILARVMALHSWSVK